MSMMRKRIIAIIAAALAIVILGVSLSAVLEYVDTVEFVDVDGTKYYAKNKDDVYKLYAKGSKEPLPTDSQYGYYITKIGTLVKLDAKTGLATEYIPVETEGNENVGFNDRVLIFPHVEKKNILSLEVHNQHGTYTFQRVNENLELDAKGDFVIKGSPLTAYNQELFAELYVGAGYTLTLMKIKDPIKRTADGSLCTHGDTGCDCVFSEYGLVAEEREREVIDEETGKVVIDEDTKEPVTEKYNYEPAYYILTDTSGNSYKIIIGDMLVTGGGYYAQYVSLDGKTETKRDAVYVIDTSSGGALNEPIETYVTPMLCYPLPMNRYYDVDNFLIGNRLSDKYTGQKLEDIYKRVISFSYIDLSERENTMAATSPYEFKLDLAGYGASDTAINSCLYNFYSPTLTRTVKFGPATQDLIDYGFWVEELDENGNVVKNEKGEIQYQIFAKYFVSYDFDVWDDSGKVTQTIHQNILISDIDYEKTGKYYVFTTETVSAKDANGKDVETFHTYDFIAEADGYMFEFLLWDEYDWVNPSYVDQNIAFIESIKLDAPGYNAIFNVDNSKSDQSGGLSSNMMTVTASQNGGNDRTTFGYYEKTDVNGYYWLITSTGIKVINAVTGKEAEIKKDIAYYDYNDLGSQALCRSGYIKCADEWIEVTADYVNIYAPGDAKSDTPGALKKKLLRYDTDLWRKYYQTLLYAYLEGSYAISDEEENAIIGDSSNLLLTMEINMKDAESAGGTRVKKVYKFYKIPGSSRKAYIMISNDGGETFNGGFYVYRNKIDKFISDSQKFFNNEIIVPDSKR